MGLIDDIKGGYTERVIDRIFGRLIDVKYSSRFEGARKGVLRAVRSLRELGDVDIAPLDNRFNREDHAVFLDVTPAALWPVNITLATPRWEAAGGDEFTGVEIQQFRSAPASTFRGSVNRTAPHMALFAGAHLPDGEDAYGARMAVGWINQRWVECSDTGHSRERAATEWREYLGEQIADYDAAARVCHGFALTRRYDHTAHIRRDGYGITFPIDYQAARELFRLREKPETASRRSALRHWVRDHWRQKRDDPDAEIYVRKHLRSGRFVFEWNGYECEFRQSRFDEDSNERLRLERRPDQ